MRNIPAAESARRASLRDPQAIVRPIQWGLPLVLFGIVAAYESWEHLLVQSQPLTDIHFTGEILFFGMLGPAAVFGVLAYIRRLLGEQWAARLELERLNRELESRVAERTAALEQRNTELARANAELKQLDQMKSEFVALVSHELRAPLTALNGGIELALQQAETLPPAARRTLEVMARESERLTRFVQSILDLSRLEAGKLTLTLGPVAVLPLLQDAADAVLSPSGDHRPVQWDVPRDLPPLWADEVYLEEIIRNFVRNADKYSPPGRPIHLSAHASGGRIHLSVTDHGPGIPPPMQTRIFERFYRGAQGQRGETGWGLGLYFARKLAEAQGGEVTLRSPAHAGPGPADAPGAAFTASLPIAESPDDFSDA
ncbi:MAG: HAMP domain-containing histidine kinase [Chloroflexi bacterium]|nr:HAMP domain-containing histidine kinase [Chloroflexota bacterium]